MILFLCFTSIFAGLLRVIYVLHRKVFKKGYYSFYELITGLPNDLTLAQLIFIRFIPPFIVGFVAFMSLQSHFNYDYSLYSIIGVLAALTNIVPAVIKIRLDRGDNVEVNQLKAKFAELCVVYVMYLLSFALLTGLGAYLASKLPNFNVNVLLPSRQGMIDTIWGAVIIALLVRTNKPL